MVFGVDLSEFQSGVDYKKAVEEGGVCFALLRSGYGRDISQKDAEFEKHYAGFGAQHIPMGAYQYSYTDSVERTIDEAKAMIKWCEGKSLPLGVWYDLEEQKIYNLGKAKVCEIALAWIAEMEKAGFKAGVYASHGWFNSVLAPIKEKGLRMWPALWSKNEEPGYGVVWQFGGSTNYMRDPHVAGIPGFTDQDYWMGDLPTEKPIEKEDKPVAKAAENKEEKYVTITIRQLSEGSTGNDVLSMQAALIAHGYSCGSCGADGDFGPATKNAVIAFQKNYKLDVDGIAGVQTLTRLYTK